MACLRCLKARRAIIQAAKAAMRGDVIRAGAEVMAVGAEIAGKVESAVAKAK